MFKFFFKKNFCDIWDNLFFVILTNLIFLAVAIGIVFLNLSVPMLPVSEGLKNIIFYFTIVLSCIILNIFIFATSYSAALIADFDTPRYADYFKSILTSTKDAALYGLFISLLIAIAFVTMPYYFNMYKNGSSPIMAFTWLLCMAFVFWFLLISLFALQWFIPIRSLLQNSFLKCLKKSYILFFDNIGFTILLGLVNILNLAVSVVTFGMAPGATGIVITNTNALRLRLYKYDWLEVNPTLTPKERKQVPWDDLLEKDKKTLGPRKFKSFFMPWKQ